MKHIAKKTALVLTALVLAVSAFSLVACNNKSKNAYTVKVIGPDGAPYTTALVQACEVGEGGVLSTCYPGVATDASGKVTLEIGKQITNKNADLIEVHLLNLPVYLTYEAPRIHKGETATIQLTQKVLNPSNGTGVGVYEDDGNGNLSLDLDNSHPYEVGEGAYVLTFDSADKKIFFAFKAEYEAVYKVYSVGDIDAAVTHLTGTAMTGIRNTGDPDFTNDNISDTDKNFSYEFEVEPTRVENEGGLTYFEVALKNPADVNKTAIICFEYVREYKDETVELEPVNPSKPLTTFAEYASPRYTYVDVDLYDASTGTFTYEMGDDGFYHVGDKSGAILVASLGQDMELNAKHDGNGNPPRCYDMGFTLQHREGGALNIGDKNYYPLLEAYVKASNTEGRYGVTEELKNFLDAYINKPIAKEHVKETLGSALPEGKEWLWACGYYEESGTVSNPFAFPEEGDAITVDVPAGGAVYYSAMARMGSITYIFMSDDESVKLSVYDYEDLDVVVRSAQAEYGSFYCEVTIPEYSYYYFAFSTIDGSAATYTVSVMIEGGDPDGSEENPFSIDSLGWQYGETTDVDWEGKGEPVYYTYTVTEEDETLYFYVKDNTLIMSVQYYDDSEGITVYKEWEELTGGLSGLTEGTVLTIMVTTEEGAGSFEFGIFNAPLGSEENPYIMMWEDDYEISVPAGGKVVYSFTAFDAGDYTFTASSANVKVVWYEKGGEKHTVASEGDSFTLTISSTASFEEPVKYYLEFYSEDEAAEYTITYARAE